MGEESRIRVVVVDDHTVVRTGIEYSLLAIDDIEFVGAAKNGAEALRLCQKTRPDVVLMDMMMPGMDGAETMRALLAQCPQVQVIALTSFQEGNLVQKALEAGAISYFSAYLGRGVLAPEAARSLAEAAVRSPTPNYGLTNREREVLALMVSGKSNLEIAEILGVSASTARFHVSTILSKMGAANRAEAAALAVKHRLASP